MGRELARGTTGEDVRATQDMLNYHLRRETPLVLDGQFGPLTQARAKLFQRGVTLRDDGIVGPRTFGELFEVHRYGAQLIVFPQLTPPTIGAGDRVGIAPPRLVPPLTLPGVPALTLPAPIAVLPPITLRDIATASFVPVKQVSTLSMTFTVVPVKDNADPVVQSTRNLLHLVNDLPIDGKFKAFIVGQIPNPVHSIGEPKTGFQFSPFSPSYAPLDHAKIGNKGSAAFKLRLFGRPGNPLPQVALEGRAEGKVELEYTGNARSDFFKATSQWNFALGLGGTF